MKQYFSIFFFIPFLFLPVKASNISYSMNGTVVGILEGDLVRVLHKGKVVKVRLSDIDCPEEGQAYAKEARQFTEMMVRSRPVTVHVREVNHLGTPIGEVVLKDEGLSLNRELIKVGLAWWQWKISDDTRYGDLEAVARNARVGLWKQENPIPPWEFRERGENS